MIGKLASDLFDTIAQCDEEPKDSDIRDIMKILGDMKKSTSEIEIEDLKDYVNDFVGRWNNPEDIKNDFDSLTSETNELMVELGNEGYFDALGVEDVPVDLTLGEEIEDDFDDELED
jgi:hypothetical protein